MDLKKLLIVYAAAFIGPFGGNAVLPLFTVLETELATSYELITLSITFLMLPFAIMQFFSGTISDLFNRHHLCVLGLFIYGIGALFVSLSQTFEFIIFARIIQGIGYGVIFPVLVALMGDLTEPEQRGKIMGFFGALTTAGIALGPLTAGFLVSFGWQYVFYITAGGAFLIGVAFWATFRGFPLPSSEKRSVGEFLSQIKNTLTKNISLFCIIGFIVFISYIGINISINKVFSPDLSGIIFAVAGFAGIIFSPFAGISINKIGRKKTAFIGAIITLVSISFLIFMNSFESFLILFFCLGIGTATIWVAFNTITVELNPTAKGTVSSLSNGFKFLGYSLGAPLYILLGIPNLYIASAVLASIALGLLFLLRVSGIVSSHH